MESLTSISSNICEDMKLLEQSYQTVEEAMGRPVNEMGKPEDAKAEDAMVKANAMERCADPVNDSMKKRTDDEMGRCVDLVDDEMKRRNDATLIKPVDSKFFKPCLGWPPWEVLKWIFGCAMQLAIQSQQLGVQARSYL